MISSILFPVFVVLLTKLVLISSLVIAPPSPQSSLSNTLSTSTVTTNIDSKRCSNPFQQRQGLNIELPDFDEIFQAITQASPLAKSVINGINGQRGFNAVHKSNDDVQWKTIESKKGKVVHEIQKADSFAGVSAAPILRFRSSMLGPCAGEYFGRYIMQLDERQKWDDLISNVKELHTIDDNAEANILTGYGAYGDCTRLGVGYALTKAALGISSREQMFVYGLQQFTDGSSLIWGKEMDEKYNYLLPDGQRHTRAKSHLFSAMLVPTSDNSFDIEYVLQYEIGGGVPSWLTTSPIVSTVKSLFDTVAMEFGRAEGSIVRDFIKTQQRKDAMLTKLPLSLLMTP